MVLHKFLVLMVCDVICAFRKTYYLIGLYLCLSIPESLHKQLFFEPVVTSTMLARVQVSQESLCMLSLFLPLEGKPHPDLFQTHGGCVAQNDQGSI